MALHLRLRASSPDVLPIENTTPVPRWEGVTTPPIPSSSPGFAPDSMDISPLPHKAPFSFAHDRSLPLPSPSPEVTPSSDGDMLSPCEDLSDSSAYPTPNIEVPRPVSAAESVAEPCAHPIAC